MYYTFECLPIIAPHSQGHYDLTLRQDADKPQTHGAAEALLKKVAQFLKTWGEAYNSKPQTYHFDIADGKIKKHELDQIHRVKWEALPDYAAKSIKEVVEEVNQGYQAAYSSKTYRICKIIDWVRNFFGGESANQRIERMTKAIVTDLAKRNPKIIQTPR